MELRDLVEIAFWVLFVVCVALFVPRALRSVQDAGGQMIDRWDDRERQRSNEDN